MRNLLFIQGGSRWKFDADGNVYTDANFNEGIWDRYRSYCDNFTVILRREQQVYSIEEATSRFNAFNAEKSRYVALPDLYRPVKNVFNLHIRNKIKQVIKEEVYKADKVIIRSLGNIYTNTALKYARQFNKPYLVEVTGFAWESMWYHSLRGKCVAGLKELQYKKLMKLVPYAVYVTNEALQKRYPCSGNSLGCSDVELPVVNESVLDARFKKIQSNSGKIILGTAAFLDVGWKGQEYVIRALAELKARGYSNFEYQMIGAGTGKRLQALTKELGVEDQVYIIGTLPHKQVFSWMDSIDIYIQSSFMEGLCRSLVESMSRACTIVCSNVGGNYELASPKCLFKKGSSIEIADILQKFADNKELQFEEARRSYEKSKEYTKEVLDAKRDKFYKEFISG